VILCSGRPCRFVQYIADQISPEVGIIGFNGARSSEVDLPINSRDVLNISRILDSEDRNYLIKTMDCIYSRHRMLEHFIYQIDGGGTIPTRTDVEIDERFAEGNRVYKILSAFSDSAEDLIKRLRRISTIRVYVYPGHGLEISNALASKANAIQALCDRNGISPRSCIYFGDDINDLPMFELGGCNYAMSGAPEAITALASEVIDNQRSDGVGRALDQLEG